MRKKGDPLLAYRNALVNTSLALGHTQCPGSVDREDAGRSVPIY